MYRMAGGAVMAYYTTGVALLYPGDASIIRDRSFPVGADLWVHPMRIKRKK